MEGNNVSHVFEPMIVRRSVLGQSYDLPKLFHTDREEPEQNPLNLACFDSSTDYYDYFEGTMNLVNLHRPKICVMNAAEILESASLDMLHRHV